MNILTILLLALGGISLLASGLFAWQTRRIVQRLDDILEAALAGNFRENAYDESTLSRLEQKLARFLAQSKLSTGAVATERARVQGLIGDISHQTKTPLANILLYTQLLAEQPLPASAHPLCGHIGTQAEKLQFLIGALVKTSRLESGVVQVRPATHPLALLLDGIPGQYRAAAAEKSIDLLVEPSPLFAIFDPRWAGEALGNLVDNAIKYTPPGGRVQVSAEESPLFTKITVSDTGPGIAEDEHAKVFDRFYRGRSAGVEGVGIGLFLARQIVSAQGGYIRLRSRPGQGSAFSIFLPH